MATRKVNTKGLSAAAASILKRASAFNARRATAEEQARKYVEWVDEERAELGSDAGELETLITAFVDRRDADRNREGSEEIVDEGSAVYFAADSEFDEDAEKFDLKRLRKVLAELDRRSHRSRSTKTRRPLGRR